MLVFTEPCVAFSYQDRLPDAAILRVYLSLEALPAAMLGLDLFEHFVQLRVPLVEVASAADDWNGQLASFPVRL